MTTFRIVKCKVEPTDGAAIFISLKSLDIQSTAIDIERVLERESKFCPTMADRSVSVPRVY
jgi:hypothetical protein